MTARARTRIGIVLLACSSLAACSRARATGDCGRCPPSPAGLVDDRAGLLTAEAESRLTQHAAGFQRRTGAALIVHFGEKMPENVVMEEYTLACANCWELKGSASPDRITIFVFVKDRRFRLEVNTSLSQRLTSPECERVVAEQMAPAFKKGDFEGGLTAGLAALQQYAND